MARLDLTLVVLLTLFVFSIALIVVAFLGEFVWGWWDQFGEWLVWFGIGLAIVTSIVTASRFQVKDLSAEIREVRKDTSQIIRNTEGIPRIEANTEAIPRIEANTEAIPRIEANTHETVSLLREIRDRLPPSGS